MLDPLVQRKDPCICGIKLHAGVYVRKTGSCLEQIVNFYVLKTSKFRFPAENVVDLNSNSIPVLRYLEIPLFGLFGENTGPL